MSISPRNLAVVEVIKQRAARGTERVIFFSLAIFAIISTLVVAGWAVNIIFAAIMGDVPSVMGISAGQDQWIAAGAIVACMMASSIWDVWNSATRGGVAATNAAREKARTVASSKPKPPLPLKSRIAALVAKIDLEARISKTLDSLASQAPETLAAAEAKAIEKAAPNTVGHEGKKSMRL